MKTLGIIGLIYGISLSFMIGVKVYYKYFDDGVQIKDDKKWWESILAVLICIIFAPIVAIVLCFVLYKTSQGRKKQSVETKKRPTPWYIAKGDGLPKEKSIEKSDFSMDISSMDECDESERKLLNAMTRNCISALHKICIEGKDIETTMEDKKLIEELNLVHSKKFGPIEAVSLPVGCALYVDFDCGDMYAKSTHFFIKNTEGQNDYKIYYYLKFENSYKGAMAAYLIDSAWYNLRLCGHAFNLSRQYIFSNSEVDVIPDNLSEQDKEELTSLFDNKNLILPQVFWKSDLAYIECTYWNSNKGLVRETKQIRFENGYVREINQLPDKVLYKYESGIRFF